MRYLCCSHWLPICCQCIIATVITRAATIVLSYNTRMHGVWSSAERGTYAGDSELIPVVVAIRKHAKQAQSGQVRQDPRRVQIHEEEVETLCARLEEAIEQGGVAFTLSLVALVLMSMLCTYNRYASSAPMDHWNILVVYQLYTLQYLGADYD